VVQGTLALETLFGTVGLGWAVNLMELPIISKLVDLLYEFLSANRISLGNALVRHTCTCFLYSLACLNAGVIQLLPTLSTPQGWLTADESVRRCSLHTQL
jgi:hypothetical protein